MTDSDLEIYYQKGGTYVIPVEVINQFMSELDDMKQENQQLKKQLEEVELIVGLRQKRNLIRKFDKEYDKEDKKNNPNRDYAGIMPDAEEVYRRYYNMKNQQKEFIKYLEEPIKIITDGNPTNISEYTMGKLDTLKEILSKYKEIIGDVEDESR